MPTQVEFQRALRVAERLLCPSCGDTITPGVSPYFNLTDQTPEGEDCPDCKGTGGLLREPCPGIKVIRKTYGTIHKLCPVLRDFHREQHSLCQSRGWLPVTNMPAMMAAIRAKGWSARIETGTDDEGDSIRIVCVRPGRVMAQVTVIDGLRGEEALTMALDRVLEGE